MSCYARLLLLGLLLWPGTALSAGDHAVVLVYHRVADSGPASTRVTPERFEEHLEWIEDNSFRVIPLSRMLRDLANGHTVDNAVVISFDDAWTSVYDTAFPALQARNMPFTVFVATDALDEGAGGFMSWDELRAMDDSGLAEYGAHSLSHGHLEAREASETESEWRERVRDEIAGSHRRLAEALGKPPLKAFAYPYGEYSEETLALLEELGFSGLAQQSGAVGAQSPRGRLPRFAIAQSFDSLERLATALQSRPLPATEASGQPFLIRSPDTPPGEFRMTVQLDSSQVSRLSCFAADGTVLALKTEGQEVTVSLPRFGPGRSKINCTAPGDDAGEFYWYSRLWTVADQDGQWLAE